MELLEKESDVNKIKTSFFCAIKKEIRQNMTIYKFVREGKRFL